MGLLNSALNFAFLLAGAAGAEEEEEEEEEEEPLNELHISITRRIFPKQMLFPPWALGLDATRRIISATFE